MSHDYVNLIIISEPHFYGLINTHTSSHVKNPIKLHHLKDYSHLSEQELKLELF